MNLVAGDHKPGLSSTPGFIHFNSNSGAQAVNLAVLWGARRLILVGYDMGPVNGKEHFFGLHPKTLKRDSPYASMIRNFDQIASDLSRMGVTTVNCSAESHLKCFNKMTLAEACGA